MIVSNFLINSSSTFFKRVSSLKTSDIEWVLKSNLFLNKDLLGILSTEIILLKALTL